MLLGLFMTTLHMPGIPLLNWGGKTWRADLSISLS